MHFRPKWPALTAALALAGSSLLMAFPAMSAPQDPDSDKHGAAAVETSETRVSAVPPEADEQDGPEAKENSEDLQPTDTVEQAETDAGQAETAPAEGTETRQVSFLNINDFHGRIVGTLDEDGKALTDSPTVRLGYVIERQRSAVGADNTLFLSAGDNFGASVFASSVQEDLPAIEFLNAMGLAATAVGNHEFDGGWEDTKRIEKALEAPILGANVFFADTGAAALPAYKVFTANDFKVAVIGAVTVETPTLVSPAGVANLKFTDPVDAVNDAVATLQALPEDSRPDLIVAEYHEGLDQATPTVEEGLASSATFAKIVTGTSADVDVIFNGHTHQQYTYAAPIPGEKDKTRPVIQTGQYGANLGQVVLEVTDEGDVADYTMKMWNVAEQTEDLSLEEIVETGDLMNEIYKIVLEAEQHADDVGSEVAATLTAPISRAYTDGTWENGYYELTKESKEDRGQASALATVVGNALVDSLAELPDAPDFGVLNPGGLRTDLIPSVDGEITVAEARAVLPFNNELTIATLTGEQVKTMLEQQWQRDENGEIPSRAYLELGLSDNVHYTYTEIADPQIEGATRGVIDAVWINGELVTPESEWKAGTFAFLSAGGDNFRVFQEAKVAETGYLDWEGFLAYLDDNSPLSPNFARAGINLEGVHQNDILEVGSELTVTASNLNVPSIGSPEVTEVEVDVIALSKQPEDGEQVSAKVENGAATVTFEVKDTGQTTGNVFWIDSLPTGTFGLVPVGLKAEVRPTPPGGDGEESGDGTEGGTDEGATKPEAGAGGKLPVTGVSSLLLVLGLGGSAVAAGVAAKRRSRV